VKGARVTAPLQRRLVEVVVLKEDNIRLPRPLRVPPVVSHIVVVVVVTMIPVHRGGARRRAAAVGWLWLCVCTSLVSCGVDRWTVFVLVHAYGV